MAEPTEPQISSRRDLFVAFLALLITLAFFVFIAALFLVALPPGNKDVIMLAAGILFGAVGTVVGFYFGSSQGSKDKSQIIDRAIETINPATAKGTKP